jgi:fido (protein-threonine AMPylation protein)
MGRQAKGNKDIEKWKHVLLPEYIEREMRRLFGWLADENFLRDLDTETFAHQAAHFVAELNTIHPFERRMAGHKTSS